ncbi:winged helix-turn-helix domain-containing protein [Kaistella sp.]|uniref:winged helix-turn-helix domain-containing protein n=1 Tax=Kaistella sp. TaxID=2782235 RepID=UPI002F935565
MIEIPKFHETFIPILKVLENGETLNTRELYKLVIEKFYSELSKDQLEQQTKSGDTLIINRIAWGKSYLKKGGFIEFPKRGMVRITGKGLANINKSLSLRDVENSSGFFEFYNEENNNVDSAPKMIVNSSPQDLIDEGFDQIERQVKDELLNN